MYLILMKILHKYIGWTVIKLTLLVLLVILGVDFFITLVSELSSIGQGNYGLVQALQYSLLSLPSNLYALFPTVGLLGSLLGLGLLAASSELVVMRTAGVSVFSIVFAVLKAALLLIVVVTLIGELVAPAAQQLADREKLLAESGGQAAETTQGLWFKSGNDFINVSRVTNKLVLVGVRQYEFDDQHRLVSTLTAKKALQENGRWWLYNVQQSRINADDSIQAFTYSKLPWRVTINARILGVSMDNASEMNLVRLYHYITYQHRNGLSASNYSLAFWQRMLQPLATLIMIFLAIPFIFGPLRSVTMGVRIVTGAMIGLIFYLLNQFFGPVSLVYQIPPVVGASLPIILFAILALLSVRRVR